ncbi:MAG: glutathione-regulated potassium-efflux system protein KefB [Burkholderiaceae bacterium]|nr:MAG: glutathione-regulated potassium-efflux system protein KefB [Burkholderiaceae bacterium]
MTFLPQVLVFLVAACIAVPLSRKSGFGSVLGYLIAGVAIGPWGLKLITGVTALLSFSEIGVVLLLFIIGLELQPSRLWALRRTVFGMGAVQVIVSTAILALGANALGLDWIMALIAGFGLSLSSTAFVLQMLAEKRQLTDQHGRAAFGILLFQDIAAIPVLALLKVLHGGPAAPEAHFLHSVITTFVVLAALFFGGRYILKPVFRFVVRFGNPEIFTAAALLIVIGAALIADLIGLSMGLGAFVAGVLLADSSYRHELEANIQPFKGLLLGLFFVAVGMSVNLGLLETVPLRVIGVTGGMLLIKGAVLYGMGRVYQLPPAPSRNLAFTLPLGGEFAFVIFNTAAGYHIFSGALADLLNLAVTLSMASMPFLVLFNEHVLHRFAEQRKAPEFDRIDEPGNPVVIAGFGRFGQIVGRVLRMQKIAFTALDADIEEVDALRRYGNKVYYGDAARLDLLRAAKVGQAKIFVLAIDDLEASVRTAETVRAHFPKVQIYARARNRHHAHLLRELGVTASVRETFYSSLKLTEQVLEGLGQAAHETRALLDRFQRYDQQLLERQFAVFRDETQLAQTTRQVAQELEHLLDEDRRGGTSALAAPQASAQESK